MRKIIILIILFLTVKASASDENISIIFTENSSKYWQYISDKTMGGISNGKATLEQDEGVFFARLTGDVSTKNNGGFIQIRSKFSFSNFKKKNKKMKGVRLNVRGNGEIYHIFIRTSQTKSYRDYYSISFKTKSNWDLVELPFNKFKNKLSGDLNLEDKDIKTFGIVAYGRDFTSDLSISNIIFYY